MLNTDNNDNTVSPIRNLNIDDLRRYLEFLGYGLTAEPSQPDSWSEVVFCGAWFTGETGKPIPQYGVWHGDFAAIVETYKNLFEIGYKLPGFHVTLNETSDNGRKESDIEAPRVLCLDVDDAQGDRESVRRFIEGAGVQLAVESSSGKFHFYWAVKRDMALSDWKVFQAGIAHRFKGDGNLSQLNHIIRVPGFPRVTKSGEVFTPQIVWSGERVELGSVEVEELFGGIVAEGQKALVEIQQKQMAETRRAMELARAAVNGRVSEGKLKGVAQSIGEEGNRNSGLYQAVKAYCKQALSEGNGAGGVSKSEAVEYGRQLNSAMPQPLEESEVRVVAIKAWRKAKAIRAKQEERIREAEKAIEKVGVGEGITQRGVEKEGTSVPRRLPQEVKVARRESNGKGALRPHGRGEGSGDTGGVGKTKKGKLERGRVIQMRGEVGFNYDYSKEPLSLDRFSDSAVAARVQQRFCGQIVRVGESIYAFDEGRRVWVRQNKRPSVLANYIRTCVADTIRDKKFIRELCLDRGGNLLPENEKRWKRHFYSGNLQGKVLGILQNENDYPVLQPTDFDANPELLFCANGVLNIRTGELKEVEASDYQLFCNKIEWKPEAKCPHWLQFLREIFAENDEPDAMVDFMHEIFGYSICGSISAQKIFVHWGSGSNGKSKLLSMLALLMGTYTTRMACNTLSKAKGTFAKEIERVTVKSEGKRLIVLDDLETKTQWDEGLVKTFTADVLPMKKLFEEGVDIPNRAKIHVGCNEPPSPEAENFGLIRRLYLISYHRKFEPNIHTDAELNANLRSELPGILAWAVRGYQKLVEQGFEFSEPEQVKSNAMEYKKEHFKMTNVLLEMFEKAPVPKLNSMKKIMESDEDWYDINELTERVQAAAELAGNYDGVSTQWVGVNLKEQFGALKRRVRIGKKRVVQYRVKFVEEGKGRL